MTSPCNDVNYVIAASSPGDVILIGRGDDQSESFCLPHTLEKSLHFIGQGRHPPRIECPQKYSSFILEIAAQTVLENVILDSISCLIHNTELTLRNCTLMDATINVMGLDTYMDLYSAGNTEMRDVLDAMESIARSNRSLSCRNASITIDTSEWRNTNNINKANNQTLTLIDGLAEDGIQVLCQTVTLNLFNSILADKVILVNTVLYSFITVVNSSFTGDGNGTVNQAGLKVFSPSAPDISIQNCSFENLVFADSFLPILQKNSKRSKYNVAAVAIQLVSVDTMVNTQVGQLRIEDSVFQNNFGAVSLSVTGQLPHNNNMDVFINRCKFTRNFNIADGGALSLMKGVNTVKVAGSSFTANSVGSLTSARLFRGKRYALSGYKYILDWFKMSRGGYGVEIGLKVANCSKDLNTCQKPQKRRIVLTFGGNGGAVAIQEGRITIETSHFAFDMATEHGDSLLFGRNVGYSLNRCTITARALPYKRSFTISATATKGSKITNSMFVVTKQSSIPLSPLYHNTKHSTDNLFVRNISFSCPRSSTLYLVNDTEKDPFGDEDHKTKIAETGLLGFIDLMYWCSLCGKDTYSLQGEKLLVDVQNGTEMVVLDTTTCIPCPYGATCSEVVNSKPNMWGQVENNAIRMYLCPIGYCCGGPQCRSYNSCAANRGSVLCGNCVAGYSEALFSPNCIPNSKCGIASFLVMLFGFGTAYVVVFIFQKDFKDFLFAPVEKKASQEKIRSKVTERRKRNSEISGRLRTGTLSLCEDTSRLSGLGTTLENQIQGVENGHGRAEVRPAAVEETKTTEEVIPTDAENEESQAQDGIFLILLFYYFQDAVLVHINTVYLNREDSTEGSLKEIVGGLFQFRFEVFSLLDDICAIPDFTPVDKIIFRMSFVVMVFCLCFLIYLGLKFSTVVCHAKIAKFQSRLVIATMFAVLFSFQSVVSTMLKLIQCISLGGKNVLLIDANNECFTAWQIGICVYLATCFIPFTLYMTLCPVMLRSNRISSGEFLIGCLVPIPVALVALLRKNRKESETTQSSRTLYNLLQGPYKDLEYRPFGCKRPLYICWGGLYLVRRLLLVLLQLFVQNVLVRLTVMTFLSLASLFHHMMVWPCKEHKANVSSFISALALVVICFTNAIKAAFEVAEYIPNGLNADIMRAVHLVEDLLILWIPVAGIILILLVLLQRIVSRVCSRILR